MRFGEDASGSFLRQRRRQSLPRALFGRLRSNAGRGYTLCQSSEASAKEEETFNFQFTDKERDPESGLDYFSARYYSSVHGRFTPVDPLPESGILEDPLDHETLVAASRELAGEVVKLRPDGIPFDHVEKVRQAQAGLEDVIETFENA